MIFASVTEESKKQTSHVETKRSRMINSLSDFSQRIHQRRFEKNIGDFGNLFRRFGLFCLTFLVCFHWESFYTGVNVIKRSDSKFAQVPAIFPGDQ